MIQSKSSQFSLLRVECPPGYELQSAICVCEDRVEVLTCDPNMQFVLLDVSACNLWQENLTLYTL